MYITNQLDVALIAEKYGVDRIFVDLETLGKAERQKNMDTVQSHHSISDIVTIAEKLTSAKMLVRINPINPKSKSEIEAVIAAGANFIMLPMWKTEEEVKTFIQYVAGRAKIILLLETKEAYYNLDDILSIEGIDEIHIGLNDLHLEFKLSFMFELLTNGIVETIVTKLRKTNIAYGFGGVAKLGYGELPAEMIIAEHYRLGSQMAILSRSFCHSEKIQNRSEIDALFKKEMPILRQFEQGLLSFSEAEFKANRERLVAKIQDIANKKKST